MVTEPVFPVKELDTLKDIKKQKLRVDNNKNAVVASKKFRQLLFTEHPYGNFLLENDLNKVNVQDLLYFFQRCFYQNFELFVSGAVSLEVEELIAKTFNDVPYKELPEIKVAPVVNHQPRQENIAKKGSLQSSIRSGRLLFNLHHPDFNRFSVLNTLFGGYFGSRLMKSIREEKGYTYGIYSNVVPMRRAGYMVIGTDVIGEFTKQTLEEIHHQIRILQEAPVDADELETVKNYMLGSFLSGLNTPFALADQYKTIYLNQLPLDHFDRYIQEINKVTAEDLLALAQNYLAPHDFSTVVVGDVEGFEKFSDKE